MIWLPPKVACSKISDQSEIAAIGADGSGGGGGKEEEGWDLTAISRPNCVAILAATIQRDAFLSCGDPARSRQTVVYYVLWSLPQK